MALHFDCTQMTQEGKQSLQFVADRPCPINGYKVGETYWSARIFNIGCLFMVIGIREISEKTIPKILKRVKQYSEFHNLDPEYYCEWTVEGLSKLIGLNFNIIPSTEKEWASDLKRIRANNRRSA